ncbi:hypothetical protein GGS20DRAFT_583031 [Poronia punctata]|nr:hypothetical protein GGS20DRAFT_583031 [Poronia punctata]
MPETLREKAVEKRHHGQDANPSQLGDPVSLEAETSESNNSKSKPPRGEGKTTLKEKAKANPTQLGDPTRARDEKVVVRDSKL